MRTPIGRRAIAWKGVGEERVCVAACRDYLNRRSSLAAASFSPAAHLEIWSGCSTKTEKTRADQLRKLAINVEGISLAGGRADGPSRGRVSDIILILVWRIRARVEEKEEVEVEKEIDDRRRDDVWYFHSFTAEYM